MKNFVIEVDIEVPKNYTIVKIGRPVIGDKFIPFDRPNKVIKFESRCNDYDDCVVMIVEEKMLLSDVKPGQRFKFIDGTEEFTKIDMSCVSENNTRYYFIDKLFKTFSLHVHDNYHVVLLD